MPTLTELIQAAFQRTKDRFLPFIFISLLSGLLFVAVVLIGLAAGLIVAFSKVPASMFFIIGISVVAFVALMYVSTWMTLAVTAVIIDEKREGVIATLRNVRSLVPGFLWVSVLMVLFMIGLLPFGILTIGLILLLWVYWSSFTAFVYLKEQRKGIENMWASRVMVNSDFFGIGSRLALITIAGWIVRYAIGQVFENSAVLQGVLTSLFSFAMGIFSTAFTYEIYKHLEKPKEVRAPKVWIGLSIVGFVLLIFGITSLLPLIKKYAPMWQQIYAPQFQKTTPPELPSV